MKMQSEYDPSTRFLFTQYYLLTESNLMICDRITWYFRHLYCSWFLWFVSFHHEASDKTINWDQKKDRLITSSFLTFLKKKRVQSLSAYLIYSSQLYAVAKNCWPFYHFYYSIQNIWTCSCWAKKQSDSSLNLIMLRHRSSSKFWYWKYILTLQTHHYFILNSATTNPYLFVWRSLSQHCFHIGSGWNEVNFLHSSLYGVVFWFYYSANGNDYSFLFRIKRKKIT